MLDILIEQVQGDAPETGSDSKSGEWVEQCFQLQVWIKVLKMADSLVQFARFISPKRALFKLSTQAFYCTSLKTFEFCFYGI